MSSEGRLDGDIEGFSNQVPVVKRLKEWFLSGDTPFCALLGDYGMGKTTTCKLLSQELKNSTQTPPVIYLDLRLLSGVEGLPTLHQMIDIALQSSWQSDHRDMDADTIIDSVRNHQALIIFDGLDEVGTHFDEDQNKRFIRELFSILPPHIFDFQNRDDSKSGKLIIACRSEFF